MTCFTSGKLASTSLAFFAISMLAVGPVLGASVPRTQIAPSSRWGRNSEPMIPLIAMKQHCGEPEQSHAQRELQ